jgi:hypothetical protein
VVFVGDTNHRTCSACQIITSGPVFYYIDSSGERPRSGRHHYFQGKGHHSHPLCSQCKTTGFKQHTHRRGEGGVRGLLCPCACIWLLIEGPGSPGRDGLVHLNLGEMV